jgi:uncharacterized protein (DUF4415 family)
MGHNPKTEAATSKPADSTDGSTKERIWLRLDREVVDHFRALKRNWNEDANAVLIAYVKQQRS